MQVVTSSATSALQNRLIVPTQDSVSSLPSPLKLMLERIASSNNLSLADKRSFADMVKNAYESNRGKQIAKIMFLISQTEARNVQNANGRYARNTLAEILPNVQSDDAPAKVDTSTLLSGQARVRQLLFT